MSMLQVAAKQSKRATRFWSCITILLASFAAVMVLPVSADVPMTLRGVVWLDANMNDLLDAGESLAQDANLLLTGQDQAKGYPCCAVQTQTDSSGRYELRFTTAYSLPFFLIVASGGTPSPAEGYPWNRNATLNLSDVMEPKVAFSSLIGSVPERGVRADSNTLLLGIPLWPLIGVPERLAPVRPVDFPIQDGHFFTQANGYTSGSAVGFAVTNQDAIPFWNAFQQYGGVEGVGYPVSQRFVYKGLTTQAFQKLVLQWQPGGGAVPINVFDELHNADKDGWLETVRAVPPPFDTTPDTGLPWEAVMARHLAFLDPYPELQAAYFAVDDPLGRYGLPMSVKDYGNVVVVRSQRAVLQQWKVRTAWAQAGQVVVANGGDVAKEVGLFPEDALNPVPPPE